MWANGANPIEVDLPGIAEMMRPAVEAWMSGRLIFTDPDRTSTTPYDAANDTGGESTSLVIWDTGVNGAIIQPIRSPSRIEAGSQPNAILGIRFQCKYDEANMPVEPLRGGLLVQVADGGNAPIPATWRFSVTEGIDSSLMWDRIIDATLVTGG